MIILYGLTVLMEYGWYKGDYYKTEIYKKELIDEARNLGLKNYSKLGKTQLIEKLVESCIFPLESLSLDKYFRDTPIDSARGVLIHIPILENQELEYLLNQQMEKEFYVPSVKQIEEICRVGYEESSLAYEKLGLSYEKAVTFCLQTWANSYEGESPAEIINKINEAGIEFQGEKQINEFLKLAMDAHNNTRMKEMPIELLQHFIPRDLKGVQ